MRPITWPLIAAVTFSPCGCGTVCNFYGGIAHPDTDPRVYGGVQRGVAVVQAMTKPNAFPVGAGSPNNSALILYAAIAGVVLAEVGCSLVGDTLTLPVVLWLQERREALIRERNHTPPADAPGHEPPAGTSQNGA